MDFNLDILFLTQIAADSTSQNERGKNYFQPNVPAANIYQYMKIICNVYDAKKLSLP